MTTSIPLHGEALSIIAQITVFVKVARRIFHARLGGFSRPSRRIFTPVSADFMAQLGGFLWIFMAFYGSAWIWGMSFSVA